MSHSGHSYLHDTARGSPLLIISTKTMIHWSLSSHPLREILGMLYISLVFPKSKRILHPTDTINSTMNPISTLSNDKAHISLAPLKTQPLATGFSCHERIWRRARDLQKRSGKNSNSRGKFTKIFCGHTSQSLESGTNDGIVTPTGDGNPINIHNRFARGVE